VQISTTTFSPSAGLGPDPIRTLVPVDFADPAVDPEAEYQAARSTVAAELGWHVIARLERAGIVVLPVQAYRELAIGATRLKSLQIREHVFDLDLKHVYRDGREIPLTPTEWAICEMLVRRVDRVIPQNEMLLRVWGPAYLDEAHLLRVNLARLRAKLEPEHIRGRAGGYTLIRTRPGIGYWMASEARS
jgi:DNA-binding response OmpR family regulator